MSKLVRSVLLASAALSAAAGLSNAGHAQSLSGLPPVPATPPPIASHSDPTLPVPTTPPEQIAGTARLDSVTAAQFLTGNWFAKVATLTRAD